MAAEIPSEEPKEAVAGDRLQWTIELDDYSAAEWSLTYNFRANLPGGIFNVAATASGTEFAVDVSPDVTKEWPAGDYYWDAYLSKTGDRKRINNGTLKILPDLSQIETPYDGRTLARKILDSINAVMLGRATHDQQRYVMQAVGRSVDRVTLPDLIRFRDYWKNEVQKEERAANGGKGKNVFIRFNR